MRALTRVVATTTLATGFLVAAVGCSASTSRVSCRNSTCDVTVSTTGSKTVKVFTKPDLSVTFRKLADDRLDVSQGGVTKTLREGETGKVGTVTVKVVDADKGKAKLTITR